MKEKEHIRVYLRAEKDLRNQQHIYSKKREGIKTKIVGLS